MGGVKVHYLFDGWYKQAIFELTMKNFRLFETEAEKNEAVIEECSVSYVIESDKVYTTPESNGEITFKILVEGGYWENDEYITFNDTLTVKAAKDMTWGEFINGEYNTLNFWSRYNVVMLDYDKGYNTGSTSYYIRYSNNEKVPINDIIVPNYEYAADKMKPM